MVSETKALDLSDGGGELSLADDVRLREECEVVYRKRKNCSFDDFCKLIEMAGFEYDRTNGDHHIYKHPKYKMTSPPYDTISIQEVDGKAKPYQIKDLIKFINLATRK